MLRYTSSDTSNSPTTKNVKTKVFCHCISSLGHVSPHSTGSVVKCSMGHYAIRRVTCEALYGDSNTLVPGIRKRAAHKTETITTPMYLDFSPKELRHCVHIESGTCEPDKQPLGDGCDTYRDYLREDQVESQVVSVPKMSRGQEVCEVLISLTGVLKMIWSCPNFSKMAVKSVIWGDFKPVP
ncbi:hypothetical protein HID58_094505 [Brassica napus]|uniref:Uncharacterized protein n=1 Tax=Brassica napus TaxID=3708 RepID=A0ABQ7X722_BRANA|nr:hypothetical protein HID58_094505 [Brassica napus]